MVHQCFIAVSFPTCVHFNSLIPGPLTPPTVACKTRGGKHLGMELGYQMYASVHGAIEFSMCSSWDCFTHSVSLFVQLFRRAQWKIVYIYIHVYILGECSATTRLYIDKIFVPHLSKRHQKTQCNTRYTKRLYHTHQYGHPLVWSSIVQGHNTKYVSILHNHSFFISNALCRRQC